MKTISFILQSNFLGVWQDLPFSGLTQATGFQKLDEVAAANSKAEFQLVRRVTTTSDVPLKRKK